MPHGLGVRILSVALCPSVDAFCEIGWQPYCLGGAPVAGRPTFLRIADFDFAMCACSSLARLGLGVLPTLENKFEAVAVGVEHVAGIVTRIVIEPYTWFAIVGRARRHRGGIG